MRVAFAVVPLVLAAAVACPASAAPAPKALASYCSPSGDVCFGVMRRDVIRFELTTAARYFSRYRLCVRAPGAAAATCGSFPVFRGHFGTWYGSVRLRPTFPAGGRGVYRVTWRLGASPLGPSLRFRV